MTMTRIVCIALLSRIVCFAVSYTADSFGSDYDTSSALQPITCSTVTSASNTTDTDGSQTRAKFVWDSVFFSRIALCGYEYEQYYAFFPFLPGLLRIGVQAVQALGAAVSADAALQGTSACFSLAAFLISAVYLHKLSKDVLQDDTAAERATLLYIWNPASVFYSAAYTESIFACAAFTGLYHLSRQSWLATICLCAASATRSNGVLHCWFILHKVTKIIIHQQHLSQGGRAIHLLLQAGLQCSLICLPVLLFQYSGWLSFCQAGTGERPWCFSRLPNIYSFVQSHYWGVGLFRYFQIHQVPNFLLAMPILCLSFTGCYKYVSQDWTGSVQLGLAQPECSFAFGTQQQQRKSAKKYCHEPLSTRLLHAQSNMGFCSNAAAPYIHHWALMTVCALCVMNVQVATRFLSACPAVYWYTASWAQTKRCKWIWGYFMTYFCLGNVLFINFYPWT